MNAVSSVNAMNLDLIYIDLFFGTNNHKYKQ